MKFIEVDKVETFHYKGHVHDLEVEQDACYTANGYVVHNSAAGCLINYLLNITDVDPLKHDLMFERFLDIARADVVDIDTDFEPRIRDDVINYMIEKFGREYVSNIGTFGITRTKVAIQDSARVLGIPAQETLAVTKAIGDDFDEDAPFEDVEEKIPELKTYLDKWENEGRIAEDKLSKVRIELNKPDLTSEEKENLEDQAKTLAAEVNRKNFRYFIKGIKGNARQLSQHAAGVLVSSDKLMDNVALGRSRSRLVTGWQEGSDFHELSDLGYYKFDILGLNNLQVVNDAHDLVKQRRGIDINWHDIDLNEKEVYEKIVKAQDHMGVFQFESGLAQKLMKDVVPSNFEELSACSSLLRPGPLQMGMDKEFARRKWGKPDENGHIWSPDEIPACIRDILEPTHGIIVFQEQFMRIGMKIGGLNNKEVNAFRKALVKYSKGQEAEAKRYAQVESYHQRFIKEACKPENLGSIEEAEKLWDLIASFAKYGFNKTISFDERVEDKMRGILTLEEVKNLVESGQRVEVRSFDGHKDIWVEVLQVHDHDIQDLVEVELEDGKKIKCTIDHKFRTSEGMLPLYEILERNLELITEDETYARNC